MVDSASAVWSAEIEIAKLLAALETSTGCRVEDISIEDIDVTRLEDRCQRLQRTVRIRLVAIAENRWLQA